MFTQPNLQIIFDIEIHVENWGDYMAARVMPLGLIVYADDIDGIIQRADQAITQHLMAYEDRGDIFDYLNDMEVSYKLGGSIEELHTERSVSAIISRPVHKELAYA